MPQGRASFLISLQTSVQTCFSHFQSDLTWTLYYMSFCMPQSMSQTVKHRQTVKPRSPNGRLMVKVHLQPLHAGVTHLHLWISQGHALWILCTSRSILPPNWWSCPAGFNSRLYHFECKVTVGCSRNILADPTPRILVRTGLNGVGKSLDMTMRQKQRMSLLVPTSEHDTTIGFQNHLETQATSYCRPDLCWPIQVFCTQVLWSFWSS